MRAQRKRSARVFEQAETIRSWDSDYYHPIAERYYDRAIAAMLRHMQVTPEAVVLDAGCGPGVHSIRIARLGHRVFAVDLSDEMLASARLRVKRAGLSNRIEFHKEDLTSLHFEDESFDYVFSWGVIIHIREIQKALDELCRIVRPGGSLALYVTNRRAWDHKIEKLVRFVLRKPSRQLEHLPLGDGIWHSMHNQPLWLWRIDEAALSAYVEAHGFRLSYRMVGEMTEIQRRLRGLPRRALLRLNNLCHRLGFPRRHSAASLLVFRKVA